VLSFSPAEEPAVARLSEPCNKFKTRLICQLAQIRHARHSRVWRAREAARIQSSRAECCEPLDANARGFKARIRVCLIDDAPRLRHCQGLTLTQPSSTIERAGSRRVRQVADLDRGPLRAAAEYC